MANPIYPIPRPGSPISETGSVATREWYNYWQNLTSNSGGPSTAELENDITIISEKLGSPDGTPENIPPQSDGGKVIGVNSIASIGALPGVVTLTLQGDSAAPGNTYYYGTNGTGAKGFYTVSSTILGTAGNIALTTGSDGVTTINLAAVTQGTAGTLRAITLDGFGRVVQNKAATITGTSNRVTVTNGDASAGLPTIDIASTYVGQTSITTLGTVTTGTWNATLIGPTFGGTGQNTVASGDILYGSAANVWSRRAIGSTNQVLIVSGGLPTWGQVSLTAGVTGTLPATNGGTGQSSYNVGDLLYASGTTALSKRSIGTSNQYLGVVGGLPTWETILDNQVLVDHLSGSTYSTAQDFVNVMHSPGIIQGGVVTDLGSGNVRVTAGTMMIRIADDDVSSLPFADFPQTDFAVPNDQLTRYFGVVYNAGVPQVQMRTTFNWDNDTEIAVGSAVRLSSTLTNVTPNRYRTGDPITNIIQRFDAISPAERDSSVGGLLIGETGTRNVTLQAGKIWSRLEDFTVAAKNSSTAPMISAFYNGVNLTFATGLTQWDNLNYNDVGTGALVALGSNKFANLWFFCSIDGTKYGWAYGTAQYNNLGAAQMEGIPAYLNQNFLNQTLLLGRFIFKQGAAVTSLIETIATTDFQIVPINDHNSLNGLQGGAIGEYYHLTNSEHTDLGNLAALGPGIPAHTGTDTWSAITLVPPADGITITNPDGSTGNPTFALAGDLAGLEALSGTGLATRTATSSWNTVTLNAPAAGFTITNPGGVAGNPTFVLSDDLGAIEALTGTGMASRTANNAWALRTHTGTTNRLTVTNGDGVSGNPTYDISATYAGQASITTLGTVTIGTWNGTAIDASHGGTGQSVYTIGDILYASSTSALSKLPSVATGNVLRSGGVGVAPAWGKVTLTTDVTGTLPIANGGTGQITASAAFDALSPTTTSQDLIVRGASSNGRLGVGSNGNVLTVTGGAVGWAAPATNGTVTSVSLALPSIFSVSGSPVTSSGTLTGTLNTQSAGTALMGPVSGSAATPTFRGPLASDIAGITNASNAPAGTIGEVISATSGSTALTSNTFTNLTSIVLTPGDWDITGSVTLAASSAVMTNVFGGLSNVSATAPAAPMYFQYQGPAINAFSLAAPSQRFNVSVNTTIYIIGFASFASGTVNAFGGIIARRSR